MQIIGAGYTPVRAVIDRAAAFIDRPTACFGLVVTHAGLAGLYFGSPHEAWQAASALSAQKHIVYVDKPFKRVISVMPELYDDLWTGAKGMYKMEPAVADGGEVVIYAPHITEVSYTHGKIIDEIGYHCRDYFMKQWDKFKQYPGGVLAHSTHVKGLGTYDAATGIETPRIQRDTGNRHSTRTLPAHQSGLSRPGHAQRGRVARRAKQRASSSCRAPERCCIGSNLDPFSNKTVSC